MQTVETSELSMAKYNSFIEKRKGVKNYLGYQWNLVTNCNGKSAMTTDSEWNIHVRQGPKTGFSSL